MDELKRWREERMLRRSLRILGDYVEGDETAARPGLRRIRVSLPGRFDLGGRTARVVRLASITREASDVQRLREAEAVRDLGPIDDSRLEAAPGGGFRVWPVPPPISPVHPEWDDPTGRRFRSSFFRALAIHLILVPAILLAATLRWIPLKSPTFSPGRDRLFAVAISDPGPAGQRSNRVTPPPAAKPPEEKPKPKPEPPKPAATKPPKPEPVKPQPAVAREKPGSVPKPVPDKEVATREEPAAETRSDAGRETEPATDPVASEGPLLAGAGPVPGSGASIGGVDGADFPYNRYLELVRGMIARGWQIPESYIAKGRRLETTVRFRINRNGSVAETAIEVPSGFAFYDQAALRAVVSVRNFPPLPQEFGGQFLVVHFQFSFTGR